MPRCISGSLVLTQPCWESAVGGSMGAAACACFWGMHMNGRRLLRWFLTCTAAAGRLGAATNPVKKWAVEKGCSLHSLSESSGAVLCPSRGRQVSAFNRRAGKSSSSFDHLLSLSELSFRKKNPTQLRLLKKIRLCGRILTPFLLLEYVSAMCYEYFK